MEILNRKTKTFNFKLPERDADTRLLLEEAVKASKGKSPSPCFKFGYVIIKVKLTSQENLTYFCLCCPKEAWDYRSK